MPDEILEFTSVSECLEALKGRQEAAAVQAPGAVSHIWMPPEGDSARAHAVQQLENQCIRYCSHKHKVAG